MNPNFKLTSHPTPQSLIHNPAYWTIAGSSESSSAGGAKWTGRLLPVSVYDTEGVAFPFLGSLTSVDRRAHNPEL